MTTYSENTFTEDKITLDQIELIQNLYTYHFYAETTKQLFNIDIENIENLTTRQAAILIDHFKKQKKRLPQTNSTMHTSGIKFNSGISTNNKPPMKIPEKHREPTTRNSLNKRRCLTKKPYKSIWNKSMEIPLSMKVPLSMDSLNEESPLEHKHSAPLSTKVKATTDWLNNPKIRNLVQQYFVECDTTSLESLVSNENEEDSCL